MPSPERHLRRAPGPTSHRKLLEFHLPHTECSMEIPPARRKLARLQNQRKSISLHLPMAAFAPLIGKNLGIALLTLPVASALAPLLKQDRTFQFNARLQARTKVADRASKTKWQDPRASRFSGATQSNTQDHRHANEREEAAHRGRVVNCGSYRTMPPITTNNHALAKQGCFRT